MNGTKIGWDTTSINNQPKGGLLPKTAFNEKRVHIKRRSESDEFSLKSELKRAVMTQ
jgi:hypothetical protein